MTAEASRLTFMRRNNMKILALITLLFAFSIPAFAADVDGKWAGMVETPNGAVPVGFTFKAMVKN